MKRFTDTDKWRDSWFQALSPSHKIAMLYIFDNCDNAGVFDPNLSLADFCIGTPIDWEAFRKAAGDRLSVLDSGKWHLTRFVDFQYGELSPDCKPHANVLRLLKGYGIQRVSKGYPNRQGKEKDKEQDKEADKDKETDSVGPAAIYDAYPRKVGRADALKAIHKALGAKSPADLLAATQAYANAVKTWPEADKCYIPHPATWFNRGSYDDDPATWKRGKDDSEAAKTLGYTY